MKSCLWGVAGALLGLVGGLALAVVLGDAITLALKISNFEGGQAYFIAFVLFPIFGLIGLILGAIMIFQGWRFNLSVVGLLLLSGVGFVYTYRAAFFDPIPQVEQVGNFALLTYENEYTEWYNVAYGLHYHDEPIQIEGITTQRFPAITTMTLPPTNTANAFIVTAAEADASRFYLVYEEAAQVKTLPLCTSASRAPVDWLDQPLGDTEYRSRNWYTHHQTRTGGRWLLLGDDCVLDLQTLTLYPVDLTALGDESTVTLDGAHLPVALSPDQQSFVRVGWVDVHTPAYEHLGEVLHLIVYNFVENVAYTLPVTRQEMRYSRLPGAPDQPDDINAAWLDHHFQWQRTAEGYDRLVARTNFTPWPLRGWRIGTGADMNYRLEPVKAEMLDKLAEFLEQEYQAKRLETDHRDESGSIYTVIDFQLGDQQVVISYSRDEYSTPHLALWQSSSMATTPGDKVPDDTLIEEISRRFDERLKTGVYDAFFDEEFLRDPVAE